MKNGFKIYLWVALLLLFVGAFAISAFAQEDANNKRVKANLVKPINITQQTSDSAATVAEINQAGVSVGLNDMQLIGRNAFTKNEMGDTGVAIEWHSISLSRGTENLSEPLTKSLASKFTTSDAKVETGQQVTVYGDWDELLKDLASLKKAQEEKVTKVKDVDEEKKSSTGLQPGTSSTTTAPSTTTPYSSMNTDIQKTTYEDCPVFINEGAKTVEEQKRKIVTGASGTIYENGLCMSTGVSYPFQTKDGNCEYQWNLEDGIATKMVQRYYERNGEAQDIGDCWASNSTYPIVEFAGVCEVYIDEPNMRAFPQTRTGILVGETKIYYNECTPQGNTEWPLYIENCTNPDTGAQKYDHDLTNHFSYPLERKYYLDPDDGTKVYVNECSRSTSVSYEHKYTTDGCGWVMDDELLRGQQYSSTYIEAPGGNLEIAPCAARTAPVPYAYVGLAANATEVFYEYNMQNSPLNTYFQATMSPQEIRGDPVTLEYIVPDGVTKITIDAIGGGYTGGQNPNTNSVSGGNCGQGPGGRAGQLVTRIFDVIPGEIIEVTPGLHAKWYTPTNTYSPFIVNGTSTFVTGSFGTIEARAGNTYVAVGPYGENGLGNRSIAQRGVSLCGGTATYYDGGLGFGAGGSGHPGFGEFGNGCWDSGGAYGAAIITFKTMLYLRPDGTYYEIPYNGD
ncbi:hypothetical protein [Pseudodesulfovibrio pelocollis]|uniref:hypothetical protein n=1 Tax=Pseudodesulfovibrio pelocollis TaxID=3051432 RepID=UPI00255AB8E1|nr:hypothetical protein [Pseudodesulfovibrio sp. SB368]